MLLYANERGQIIEHPSLEGLGRSGSDITEILSDELIPLPEGATLVSLPNTRPVGWDEHRQEMVRLDKGNAVGALLPQGFTRLLIPAYVKADVNQEEKLPMFGYTAVVIRDEQYWVAADATDDSSIWNPQNYSTLQIKKQTKYFTEKYPDNRLYEHLSNCALHYECLTASNTFLEQLEGGLPVSYACNAGCFGCISEQPDDSGFPSPQTRMTFNPTADEMVEVMLEHLKDHTRIISFGQGCEGEPATQARTIIDAIKRVRAITDAGYININTNAGLSDHIRGIVDAGLDLMRVSTISAIDEHYNAYYRPRGYSLENVYKSLRYAADHDVFTSINYLIFPGVTDREEEIEAMINFAQKTNLKRIQFRNLNLDPESYLALIPDAKSQPIGMKQMLHWYREALPQVALSSYTHPPHSEEAVPTKV